MDKKRRANLVLMELEALQNTDSYPMFINLLKEVLKDAKLLAEKVAEEDAA